MQWRVRGGVATAVAAGLVAAGGAGWVEGRRRRWRGLCGLQAHGDGGDTRLSRVEYALLAAWASWKCGQAGGIPPSLWPVAAGQAHGAPGHDPVPVFLGAGGGRLVFHHLVPQAGGDHRDEGHAILSALTLLQQWLARPDIGVQVAHAIPPAVWATIATAAASSRRTQSGTAQPAWWTHDIGARAAAVAAAAARLVAATVPHAPAAADWPLTTPAAWMAAHERDVMSVAVPSGLLPPRAGHDVDVFHAVAAWMRAVGRHGHAQRQGVEPSPQPLWTAAAVALAVLDADGTEEDGSEADVRRVAGSLGCAALACGGHTLHPRTASAVAAHLSTAVEEGLKACSIASARTGPVDVPARLQALRWQGLALSHAIVAAAAAPCHDAAAAGAYDALTARSLIRLCALAQAGQLAAATGMGQPPVTAVPTAARTPDITSSSAGTRATGPSSVAVDAMATVGQVAATCHPSILRAHPVASCLLTLASCHLPLRDASWASTVCTVGSVPVSSLAVDGCQATAAAAAAAAAAVLWLVQPVLKAGAGSSLSLHRAVVPPPPPPPHIPAVVTQPSIAVSPASMAWQLGLARIVAECGHFTSLVSDGSPPPLTHAHDDDSHHPDPDHEPGHGGVDAGAVLYEDELGQPTTVTQPHKEQAKLINPSAAVAAVLTQQYSPLLRPVYEHDCALGGALRIACVHGRLPAAVTSVRPSAIDLVAAALMHSDPSVVDAAVGLGSDAIAGGAPPLGTPCSPTLPAIQIAMAQHLGTALMHAAARRAAMAHGHAPDPIARSCALEMMRWVPRHAAAAATPAPALASNLPPPASHAEHVMGREAPEEGCSWRLVPHTGAPHATMVQTPTMVAFPLRTPPLVLSRLPPYVQRQARQLWRAETQASRLAPLFSNLYQPCQPPSPAASIHTLKALSFLCTQLPSTTCVEWAPLLLQVATVLGHWATGDALALLHGPGMTFATATTHADVATRLQRRVGDAVAMARQAARLAANVTGACVQAGGGTCTMPHGLVHLVTVWLSPAMCDVKTRCHAVRLQAHAHALTTATTPAPVFGDMVFPLFTPGGGDTPTLDIVLVHGLQGAALKTWRTPVDPLAMPYVGRADRQAQAVDDAPVVVVEDATLARDGGTLRVDVDDEQTPHWYIVRGGGRMMLWPAVWLVRDLARAGVCARVLAVAYDADMLSSSSIRPHQSLRDVARCLAQQLTASRVGMEDRPVVWLTHSMGGIVTKMILAGQPPPPASPAPPGHAHPLSHEQALLAATRLVAFYGVPHLRAPLAEQAVTQLSHVHKWLGRSLTTPQVIHLGDTKELVQLNTAFGDTVRSVNAGAEGRGPAGRLGVVSLAEGKATPLPRAIGLASAVSDRASMFIVPPEAADPGYGVFAVVPHADHVEICKPPHLADVRYTLVRDHILQHVGVKVAAGP